MESKALAVFAKRPVAGRVKTRLTPALSPEAAAALHWAMVQDTWRIATQIKGVEPILFVDEFWNGFAQLSTEQTIQIQINSDLGSRMYSCLKWLKGQEFKCFMIIGTDSPTTPQQYLLKALEVLQDERDAVLGPAEDGGYYLVGCRRPHEAMFAGVPWSSGETLKKTQEAFGRVGFRTHLAPIWWDVDTLDDLGRLQREPIGQSVRAWMEEHRPPHPEDAAI